MNTDRHCGCKGYRSCFQCENEFGITREDVRQFLQNKFPAKYRFDLSSKTVIPCCISESKAIPFHGIKIFEDFITADEESRLVSDLDELPWDLSQSGRRKQNFGPKANFKRRKAKVGDFQGFPRCTKFIQDRFSTISCLKNYRTVEQCSIEYRPETGACIEPHIDDCWIWGERIVQLNLLSDSVLSMTPFCHGEEKYNLKDVPSYPRILSENGDVVFDPFDSLTSEKKAEPYERKPPRDMVRGTLQIPLPRRSLLVMFGEARYDWEHCILREDIHSRRIVIAYRELTPPYLPRGAQEDLGRAILEKAELFW